MPTRMIDRFLLVSVSLLTSSLMIVASAAADPNQPANDADAPSFCEAHPNDPICGDLNIANAQGVDADGQAPGPGGGGGGIACPNFVYHRTAARVGDSFSELPSFCGGTSFHLLTNHPGFRIDRLSGKISKDVIRADQDSPGDELTLRVRMCYSNAGTETPKPYDPYGFLSTDKPAKEIILWGSGDAKNSGSDKDAKVMLAPDGCAEGESALTGSLHINVRDPNPLELVEASRAGWALGTLQERKLVVRGGQAPYRMRRMAGVVPQGVAYQSAPTAHANGHAFAVHGRLAQDGSHALSFEVRDGLGRALPIPFEISSRHVMLLCQGPNLTGPCATVERRDLGDSGERTEFLAGELPNQVRSIGTKGGFDAIICDQALFGGECFNADSNSLNPAEWSVATMGGDAIEIGSLDVWAFNTLNFSHTPEGTSPQQAETPWSEAAQGIAHDDGHWFFNNHDRIYRYPLGVSRTGNQYTAWAQVPAGTRDMKDPAVSEFDGLLYMPLQKKTGPQGAVAVFNTNLQLQRVGTIPTARCPQGHPPSIVAPHPRTGHLFVACGAGTKDHLDVYRSDFEDGEDLEFLYQVNLNFAPNWTYTDSFRLPEDMHGETMRDLRYVQGGEFSSNGTLYIVAENWVNLDLVAMPGVYIFTIEGDQALPQSRFEVGYGGSHFVCYHDPIVSAVLEAWEGRRCFRHNELEGITIWDRGDSQIHVMKLENEGGQDDVGIRHYSVPDPDRL